MASALLARLVPCVRVRACAFFSLKHTQMPGRPLCLSPFLLQSRGRIVLRGRRRLRHVDVLRRLLRIIVRLRRFCRPSTAAAHPRRADSRAVHSRVDTSSGGQPGPRAGAALSSLSLVSHGAAAAVGTRDVWEAQAGASAGNWTRARTRGSSIRRPARILAVTAAARRGQTSG